MVNKQEPWTRLAHSKKLPGWVAYNPRTMRPQPLGDDTEHMKILSYNVNGLRNVVPSGQFSALAQRENFDVLCLQETHLKLKTDDAGFTVEERESFEINFTMRGFVDTFRKQHPKAVGYTFWGENQQRNNKGWRLDYFLASGSIIDRVHDSYILPDVTNSDHSPIGLVLKI